MKEKAIQEIKVWRLINLLKRVIKTVKKLRRNKVNLKVRSALVKKIKRNIFQRKSQAKNKRVKKVREKIWAKPT